MLTRAKPTSPDPAAGTPAATGVGANGAGGSGGPLVSGVSDYSLEGSATELQGHVNHQVRVTGRLDPRQTIAEGSRTGGAAAPDTPGANSGTSGSGVGSPGGLPATTGGVSGGASESATSPVRRLVVESVEMIAPACAQR
jgi:hypothetical protein